MCDVEQEKRLAAEAAAELVQAGQRVGLGTGSTVAFLLPALAARGLDRLRCVATSVATEDRARELGLQVEAFDGLDRLDIAIDGTDQVTPDRWLVKGGGAAHTREKVVAAAADRFVVIAGVRQAGGRHPRAHPARAARVRAGRDAARARRRRAARRPALARRRCHRRLRRAGGRPAALAARLDAVPGVVSHGIFPPSLVSDVLIARGDSVSAG